MVSFGGARLPFVVVEVMTGVVLGFLVVSWEELVEGANISRIFLAPIPFWGG